jgi:hypothetical protein
MMRDMMCDRASFVFATPEEISRIVARGCEAHKSVRNVRLWHKADIPSAAKNVRLRHQSGLWHAGMVWAAEHRFRMTSVGKNTK